MHGKIGEIMDEISKSKNFANEYRCADYLLEIKTVKTRRFLNIPFIWVKETKYSKEWSLFNFIPIYTSKKWK